MSSIDLLFPVFHILVDFIKWFCRIKIMSAGTKTGLTNKKDQSTGQKKRSVYQTNSGKYFVSVLRRIDSVIGFTSTSLAPAFIAFSLSELKAEAVCMIIGISLFSPRMIFVASSPFITGILMSIRIALASLPYSLNSATISSPFLAHCISHFFPMIALINLKLLSSSSATKI